MKKALIVAKWEFIEKVKTKTFIISLILTPAIIIAFAITPTLLSNPQNSSTQAIGVIDTSGFFFKPLENVLEKYKIKNGQPRFLLINLAGNEKNSNGIIKTANMYTMTGRIEGYLLINSGGTDTVSVEFRHKSSDLSNDIEILENAFNEVRIDLALSKEGIGFQKMKVISSIVDIKNIEVDKEEGGTQSQFLVLFFTSFIYIILLMMMILSSGGMLIRSLVEEKSNRLIEILVSSCSPDELLTGKVIGLSSLGITQVLIWTFIGLSLVTLHVIPSQVFNNIIPILVYFALGFIFYTSIFVGVGSIVTTEQEAQQITSYLSLVLVLPIVLTIPAMENPGSILVQILSYIPFTIPSIMILRFNIGAVPTLDIITTSVVMVVSTYMSVGIAARIFRIGVLSYGKRPSVKELISWIKEE
jgi:ABC-2 type transport system permease protein